MIDMQDILCALKVAEEKSITSAASKLFLTQSAVSQKISKIEKELGLTLFIRGNRSAELTDAGRYFVTKASNLQFAWRDFFFSMEHFSSMNENKFFVGLPPLVNFSEIPALLSGFVSSHPHWQINTLLEVAGSQHENLLNGKLDFSFDRGSLNTPRMPKYITAVPLKEDSLCVLLHHDDSLVKKGVLSDPSDLTGYHMLINDPHNTHEFDQAAQITYSVCQDSFSPTMITKPGIFIPLPESSCDSITAQYPHLRAIPYKDKYPICLYLLYRSDKQNIEKHPFYQYVRNYYRT